MRGLEGEIEREKGSRERRGMEFKKKKDTKERVQDD